MLQLSGCSKKDSVIFETILGCSNIFDWNYNSFTQTLLPIFSDDGTNTKVLEVTTYRCFLDFLETCNFDGMFVLSLSD